MSTSLGSTCEYAGISSTSSKVKPSPKKLMPLLLGEEFFIVAMCKGNYMEYMMSRYPGYCPRIASGVTHIQPLRGW
jgi:hypothetical protein